MKLHTLYIIIAILMIAAKSAAQERVVENRPYCDLRPLHFGVIVGTHMQDMEFLNFGTLQSIDGEGGMQDNLVTCEQDRWDNGFQVGVLAEARLSSHLALRIAPQMYFGNRHLVFRNFAKTTAEGKPEETRQDMKAAYVMCALDVIYAAKRFNNHRPYMLVGLSPAINLSTKANDNLRLKRTDVFLEAGIGCDYYLPFFKLRPELKFMYSLGNSLLKSHTSSLRDPQMLQYATNVNKASSKMIALTFYFE